MVGSDGSSRPLYPSGSESTPGPGAYASLRASPRAASASNLLGGKSPRFAPSSVDVPGPGQYETQGSPKKAGKSATGMGSGVQRDVFQPSGLGQPGPGSYTKGASWRSNSGLSAFKSSSPRFGNTGSDSPGPGSYSASIGSPSTKKAATPPPTAKDRLNWPNVSGAGSPGPGSYVSKEGKKASHTRNASFGGTSSRFPKDETDVPGPGSYTANQRASPSGMKLDSGSQRNVFSPKAGNEPGPGAYGEKKGAFAKALAQAEKKVGLVGFGTGSGRFQPADTDVPGVGAYTGKSEPGVVVGSSFMSQEKRSLPFETTGSDAIPGPGAYYSPAAGRKSPGSSKSPVSFNQSQTRFPRETNDVPGPGTYVDTIKAPVHAVPVSSGPERKLPFESAEQFPGPGAYTAADRSTLSIPLNASMGSGSSRLSSPSKVSAFSKSPRFTTPANAENPGPGTYKTPEPPKGVVVAFKS